MVSVLALYSDDPSSYPAEASSVKTNVNKEARVGPFLRNF